MDAIYLQKLVIYISSNSTLFSNVILEYISILAEALKCTNLKFKIFFL